MQYRDDNIIKHIMSYYGVTKNDLLLYLTRRKNNNNSVLSIQTTFFFLCV